jgi:NADPH:quinone reductase-like Zn-dependent oxidoreductase
MRAIVMHQTGGPEVLRLEEIPAPEPGPGQFLVRVEAIAVSSFEARMRAGGLPLPGRLPAVPGAEAAGTVTRTGAGADERLAGKRVAVVTGGMGSYAEYVAVPATMATEIPGGLSPADAVAVAPGGVALGLLDKAALSPGDTVLAEAGASTVGSYLIQFAREAGAGRIIATAGTPARRGHVHALGADIVLDHAQPDWPQALRDALDGSTVDVAFESIGGPAAQQVAGTLTPGTGRMVCYGNLSGEPTIIDLATLRGSGATVTGCGGPAWFTHVLTRSRPEIFRRALDGSVRPRPDSVMPLEEAAKAHQRIEDRAAQGRIILVP